MIFNVSGNVNFNANLEGGTGDATKVIWNFYNASTVNIGTQLAGTVLATKATTNATRSTAT